MKLKGKHQKRNYLIWALMLFIPILGWFTSGVGAQAFIDIHSYKAKKIRTYYIFSLPFKSETIKEYQDIASSMKHMKGIPKTAEWRQTYSGAHRFFGREVHGHGDGDDYGRVLYAVLEPIMFYADDELTEERISLAQDRFNQYLHVLQNGGYEKSSLVDALQKSWKEEARQNKANALVHPLSGQ